MRYVGVGRRLVAFSVDLVISILWTYPFLQVDQSPGYFHAELRAGGFVGAFVIGILYATVMEALFGATIGKLATGLRVVRTDGTKLDVPSALIRNTMRVIDVLLLGAILVWTSPMKQRLGDRIARTVVVEASSVDAAPGPGEAPGAAMWTPSPMGPDGITPPPMPPPPPTPGGAEPVPGPLPPPDHRASPDPDREPVPGPLPPPEN